jgi:uncharacterized membrane protein
MTDSNSKKDKLPAISEDQLVEQLAQLPEEERNQVLKRAVVEFSRTEISLFTGPVPPADELAKYAELLPDAPERCFKMAERQQEIAAQVVAEGPKTQRFALALSAGVAALMLALAAYLASIGEPLVAIPIGLAGFAGLFIKNVWGFLRNINLRQ